MFDRAEGEAGFSVGSSGRDWQGAANHDGFIELSIIGGDAAEAFEIEAGQFKKPIELTIPGIVARNDNLNGGTTPVLVREHDDTGTLEVRA